MTVDKVLEVLEALPRGGGDARLGKGETWKFQQSMFTRLDEIGQRSVPSLAGRLPQDECHQMKQVKSKLGMDVNHRMDINIGNRSLAIHL